MGEKGVAGAWSSKNYGDETRLVVGKVISTQIPTTIPMKQINVSLTTMTTIENEPRVLLKGISIKEGERRFK